MPAGVSRCNILVMYTGWAAVDDNIRWAFGQDVWLATLAAVTRCHSRRAAAHYVSPVAGCGAVRLAASLLFQFHFGFTLSCLPNLATIGDVGCFA